MPYFNKISVFFLSVLLSGTFFSCKDVEFNKVPVSAQEPIIQKTIIPSDEFTEKNDVQREVIDSSMQYVYLTFDDGPYEGSKKINQILSEEEVEATVFLVGFNAYTDKLSSYVDEYKKNKKLEIANHTFTHANNHYAKYYSEPDTVLKDIKKNEVILNLNNRVVRLPGRNVWRLNKRKKNDFDEQSRITADLIARNRYLIYGWDYEWQRTHPKHPLEAPQSIYDGIVSRLDNQHTFEKNHLVILMHDDMFDKEEDAQKLRELIGLLKENKKIVLQVISKYPNLLS